MDNNDLKKWLAEQISYLEKTKEQPDKFAWDPEYDLQLAAFRLAIEALHGTCNHFREVTKMVPLTLEQLQEMERPTPAWAEVEGKTIEGWDGYWCLCQNGKILAPSRLVIQAECMDGVEFYAYPPAHIDREAWTAEWIYPVNEWNLPVCSKCGCNSKDATYGHKDNFCPKCGRAMTPEAWAELEKRLMG